MLVIFDENANYNAQFSNTTKIDTKDPILTKWQPIEVYAKKSLRPKFHFFTLGVPKLVEVGFSGKIISIPPFPTRVMLSGMLVIKMVKTQHVYGHNSQTNASRPQIGVCL